MVKEPQGDCLLFGMKGAARPAKSRKSHRRLQPRSLPISPHTKPSPSLRRKTRKPYCRGSCRQTTTDERCRQLVNYRQILCWPCPNWISSTPMAVLPRITHRFSVLASADRNFYASTFQSVGAHARLPKNKSLVFLHFVQYSSDKHPVRRLVDSSRSVLETRRVSKCFYLSELYPQIFAKTRIV